MSNGPKHKSEMDGLLEFSIQSLTKDESLMGKLMQEKVEEAAQKRAALMEAYIKEYLKVTGHRIEDLTIVEEMKEGKMIWYLALKSFLQGKV